TPIAGRFVVPGENRFAATLDHARTVVRRAERKVVECVDEGYLDGEDLLPWLNRVSDARLVLARSAERTAPTRKIAKRDTRRRSWPSQVLGSTTRPGACPTTWWRASSGWHAKSRTSGVSSWARGSGRVATRTWPRRAETRSSRSSR